MQAYKNLLRSHKRSLDQNLLAVKVYPLAIMVSPEEAERRYTKENFLAATLEMLSEMKSAVHEIERAIENVKADKFSAPNL